MKLRRRTFVRAIVASAASPVGGCFGDELGDAFPEPSEEAEVDRVFPQGLASGDPTPSSVLLWTRVEPVSVDDEVEVRWYVARDKAFEDLVATGDTTVGAMSDHTLRIKVVDLEPYTTYYYRFTARGVTTGNGRTKSAPASGDDVAVRFAIASCQEYVGRWYHAWKDLADNYDDVDFVLFLGDYIYEWISDPRFQPPDGDRRLTLPDGLSLDGSTTNLSAVSLADYRALYQQYKSDPDLKRAHALFPFVTKWDDHEFCNDAWQDVANDFDGERGIERSTERREAATRAWFEYLPVEVEYDASASFPDDIRTYRSLRFGRHVELLLTDERYYRDDHVVPETDVELSVGKLTPNSMIGSRVLAIKDGFDALEDERKPTMLGATQRDWFVNKALQSDATWKLWGSALMVAQLALDLRELEEAPALLRNEFYFKLDQWDGFRSERSDLLTQLSSVENLVVLSGDLHGNYAAHLRPDFDAPESEATAVEITVTGISSLSLQEQVELAATLDPMLSAAGLADVTHLFDDVLRQTGSHFAYANSSAYGYAVVDVDGADQLTVEFVEIGAVTDREPASGRQVVQLRVPTGGRDIELS